ncbi:hypothetical protein F5888DRAFT_1804077 [Russula emetica]|nr:hypothetical protein F5888DRAFT_1804077 [Russula emetica]
MDIRKNDVRASSIQSYEYARDLAKMLKTEITYRVIKEEKKDIKKKNICNVFSEDTTLNGSTNGYDFIGVYTLGVLDGSQPKTVLTVSTTRGIHIMPPTRMTLLMSEALTPAFLKDSTVRWTRGALLRPDEMKGKLISVWEVDESSVLAVRLRGYVGIEGPATKIVDRNDGVLHTIETISKGNHERSSFWLMCCGLLGPDEMKGKLISVWEVDKSSILAFSAASWIRRN